MRAKKNLTIAINYELFKKIKVAAATEAKSLSRYIADFLERQLDSNQSYDLAMKSYLARDNFLNSKDSSYPKREELYE